MYAKKPLIVALMAGAAALSVSALAQTPPAAPAAPAAPPVAATAPLPPGVIVIDGYKYALPESAKANLDATRALIAVSDALGATRDNSYGGATHVVLAGTLDGWEYTGTGTMGGQPAKVVFGVDYRFPAIRMDITRGTAREVIVASGDLAWDESKPGVYSGPAKTSVQERLVQGYLLPGAVVTFGRQAVDKIKLGNKNGLRELTIPVAKMGTDLRATIDAASHVVHTEMTVGGKVYSADFSGNWTNDGLDWHIYFPSKIVLKTDGAVTADLNVTEHWANPYLIWPVPAALKK